MRAYLGAVHVRPVDDLVEHHLSTACDCGPKIETHQRRLGDVDLFTHSSLDGRELLDLPAEDSWHIFNTVGISLGGPQ